MYFPVKCCRLYSCSPLVDLPTCVSCICPASKHIHESLMSHENNCTMISWVSKHNLSVLFHYFPSDPACVCSPLGGILPSPFTFIQDFLQEVVP